MIKALLAASLGVGEIILIVACASIVVSAIATAIIRKVKGKSSCGGDCGNCCACAHCKSDKSVDTKNIQK